MTLTEEILIFFRWLTSKITYLTTYLSLSSKSLFLQMKLVTIYSILTQRKRGHCPYMTLHHTHICSLLSFLLSSLKSWCQTLLQASFFPRSLLYSCSGQNSIECSSWGFSHIHFLFNIGNNHGLICNSHVNMFQKDTSFFSQSPYWLLFSLWSPTVPVSFSTWLLANQLLDM